MRKVSTQKIVGSFAPGIFSDYNKEGEKNKLGKTDSKKNMYKIYKLNNFK